MFSVMQSSRTLCEAMTKRGRCSGFRQRPFDVSATTGCCRGCLHCCVGFRFGSVIPEVCGKIRNPRAHRPFCAKKPQVEALRDSSGLGIFRICRILPDFGGFRADFNGSFRFWLHSFSAMAYLMRASSLLP